MNKPSVWNTAATLAALGASLWVPPALALDTSWSGFATLGYARSNSDYTYQRFIDRDGTIKADSVLGGQLDVRWSPQWSGTVQLRLAPADNHDSRWRVEPSWAFVAWRPNNDWLLRAGKLRVPLYFYSESLDVGVSHDLARLPNEMYSIAPTNDVYGAYVSRSFNAGERDVTVDAYAGKASGHARFWSRDGAPPAVQPGALFTEFDVKLIGTVLTVRDPALTWRVGLHFSDTKKSDGERIPTRFPRVTLAPGLGYYQVNDAIPGPGVQSVSSVQNLLLTGGAEWQLGGGWRVLGEFAKMHQFDTEVGSDSVAGYLAIFKRWGDFTPYVTVAGQRSSAELRGWARRLKTPGLPAQLPGAAAVNAAQRLSGESLYAFNQHSLALGLALAVTTSSKLKVEWMQTKVADGSNHFDTPPGKPDARGLKVNTLSVNYSIAF